MKLNINWKDIVIAVCIVIGIWIVHFAIFPSKLVEVCEAEGLCSSRSPQEPFPFYYILLTYVPYLLGGAYYTLKNRSKTDILGLVIAFVTIVISVQITSFLIPITLSFFR